MNTGDAENSTCEAAEERLAYGTGKSYRSVEHEDRSILPTEVDGTALVMSESSASGYKGVFFAQGHSGSQPYRVEYGAGPAGEHLVYRVAVGAPDLHQDVLRTRGHRDAAVGAQACDLDGRDQRAGQHRGGSRRRQPELGLQQLPRV